MRPIAEVYCMVGKRVRYPVDVRNVFVPLLRALANRNGERIVDVVNRFVREGLERAGV